MTSEMYWYILIGAIIHYLILGWVISIATSSSKKNRLLEAQLEILMKIASGVTYDGVFKGVQIILELYSQGKLVRPNREDFVIDTCKK
jgi:hypothetical protein